MPIQGERSAPIPAEFKPMTEFPEKEKTDKSSSILVLCYDADDFGHCELGYYDFDSNAWVLLSDFSRNLICWRHVPEPTNINGYKPVSSL